MAHHHCHRHHHHHHHHHWSDSSALALALFSSCFHSFPFDTIPFHLLCPRNLLSWSALSAHFSGIPHTIVCLWKDTSEIYLELIIVLSIDIPTQLEPGFINNKCKVCPQKPVTEMHPVITAFLSSLNLSCFVQQ
jgi:hypothetical protein